VRRVGGHRTHEQHTSDLLVKIPNIDRWWNVVASSWVINF